MAGRVSGRRLLLGAAAGVVVAAVAGWLLVSSLSSSHAGRSDTSATRWQNHDGKRVDAADLHERLGDIERASGKHCFLAGTRVPRARATVRLLNFGYCGPVVFGGHHEYEVYVVLDAGGLLAMPYQLTARSDLAYIPSAARFCPLPSLIDPHNASQAWTRCVRRPLDRLTMSRRCERIEGAR